jgi:hypothetical protein
VGPARRRRVGELAYGVDDPAPYCGAVVVLLGEKFIGPRRAFMRAAARQMLISGITPRKLLTHDL